jgi:hypothetical protein
MFVRLFFLKAVKMRFSHKYRHMDMARMGRTHMRAKGQLHAKRILSQLLSDVQARGHAALKFNETGAASSAGNLFTFSTQLARGASHILALSRAASS